VETENITEEYSIRTAVQSDIPNIVSMRLKLQEHMEQANDLILRYKDEWKNNLPDLYTDFLRNSNAVIMVAETKHGNKIVGMMAGTINEHFHFTVEKSVKIDDVWVEVEHRKKGICSQILAELLKYFSGQGIEYFTLNYVLNNFEAENTWRKLGFIPTIVNSVAKMKD